MLWYILISLGFVTSMGLLYYGFAKPETAGPPFQLRHLVVGRRSIAESSRKQLLIEGFFLLSLSALVLVYKLLR
jgi:hypothetical protein